MKKTVLLCEGPAYVSPSIKTKEFALRRVLCASTGNLNKDKYGDEGSAGGVVEEGDGGDLF